MGSDDAMNGASEDLVRQLRRLEPAGHTLDRDALMFRAGQRSAGRRLRLWQSLAGAMLLVAAGLGWPSRTLHGPPQERGLQTAGTPVERETALRAEARAPRQLMATEQVQTKQGTSHEPTGFMDPMHPEPVVVQSRGPVGDYWDLRRRVTLEGVDALPSSGGVPARTEPIQTIADWLRLPRGAAFSSDPFAISRAPTKRNPS